MGKQIGIYWYFIADVLTKGFLEMLVEWSSTKHLLFVRTSQFDWLAWRPNASVCEKTLKINYS